MEEKIKNRIKIDIAGTRFTVLSVEGEEYTKAVAGRLNKEIEAVRRAASGLSLTSAVMLASLNICDAMTKAEEDSDKLRSQVKEYLNDAARYRAEYDAAIRENEKLKKDIETYRKRLSEKGRATEPAPVSPAVKTVRKINSKEAEDEENLSFFDASDKK